MELDSAVLPNSHKGKEWRGLEAGILGKHKAAKELETEPPEDQKDSQEEEERLQKSGKNQIPHSSYKGA